MGERALAARRCSPGECAWYHSQWGARDDLLRQVFRNEEMALCTPEWTYQGRTSWSDRLETLDYLRFEALYEIHSTGVVVSLPVWLGFGAAMETEPAAGILVETSSLAEYRRRKAAIRQLKSKLGRAIESGSIAREQAQKTLRTDLILRGWIGEECRREQSE